MVLRVVRTCILLKTGMVRCWGNGGNGALGQDNTIDLGDGELRCWGDNSAGQRSALGLRGSRRKA